MNGELSNEVFATIPIVPLFTHPRFSTVDESDYTVQQFMDVKKIMAQNHTHKRRSDKFQFSDEMSANLRRFFFFFFFFWFLVFGFWFLVFGFLFCFVLFCFVLFCFVLFSFL